MLSISKLEELNNLARDKVANTLLSELRGYTGNLMNAAYSIAYAIVKASETENSDLSSLDSFICSCKVNEEVASFVSASLTGIWDIVTRVKGIYDAEMYKSFLLFFDVSGSQAGYGITPNCVSQLAIKLLDIQNDDKVADYCTGKASFIRECLFVAPNAQYYGNDINHNCTSIAIMRSEFLGDDISVVNQDVINLDYENYSFDKIFSNYPFGVKFSYGDNSSSIRYINRNISSGLKSYSMDWLSLVSVINTLNDSGKAFVLAPAGVLFRGNERDMRKYFVDNGYFNTIIALPEGLFDCHNVRTVAILLSHNNDGIRFVDARDIFTKGRRYNTFSSDNIKEIVDSCSQNTKYSRFVEKDDILEKDYNLDTDCYFESEIDIPNGVAFETVIKRITRGAQLKASQLDELESSAPTKYQYLMLSDIQNGRIKRDLSYLSSISPNLEKYCIRYNSLILSKSGTVFKSAIADSLEDNRVLATGNMYVIELDDNKINPYYLKAFLDSDVGVSAMKAISVGSVVSNISIDSIRNMIIPLPDLAIQNEIAKKYLAALDELEELGQKIEQVEERLRHIYG